MEFEGGYIYYYDQTHPSSRIMCGPNFPSDSYNKTTDMALSAA